MPASDRATNARYQQAYRDRHPLRHAWIQFRKRLKRQGMAIEFEAYREYRLSGVLPLKSPWDFEPFLRQLEREHPESILDEAKRQEGRSQVNRRAMLVDRRRRISIFLRERWEWEYDAIGRLLGMTGPGVHYLVNGRRGRPVRSYNKTGPVHVNVPGPIYLKRCEANRPLSTGELFKRRTEQ